MEHRVHPGRACAQHIWARSWCGQMRRGLPAGGWNCAATMRKTGLHILRLVFPPFSNQEGELLWNDVEVENLDAFRQFSEFHLYYVGISKKGDSFSRLFNTAHEKRSRILGNEKQLNPTARLTDELTIFLFDIEDLNIIQYDLEDLDT